MQAVLELTKQLTSALTFNSTASPKTTLEKSWWKNTVCYQVWPASFKDSNGDGLGDIPGLISKLDYLKDLGADVVWLSPMYASPQVDFGYDISDYENVHPPFGTLEDMDKLISGLHSRGMKLILDLVVNHTSDQHAWFKESASSRDNPKADWYIWRDPTYDSEGKRQPPNNWGSIFFGSAWEYVEARDQYYLHIFAVQQPDLNWECEAAREAIKKSALKFWFDKGVDGFRVDTANLYSKEQSYRDGPVEGRFAPYGNGEEFYVNGPRIHEFYQEMRNDVINKYGDPMMVGELPGTALDETLRYVSTDRNELSMVFDFGLPGIGGYFEKPKHEVDPVTLPGLKKAFTLPQSLASDTKAWATVFAENHDIPRSLSRIAALAPKPDGGLPEWHSMAGKVMAMLCGSLSGTLFIYQGQEIGMTNHPRTWKLEDIRDVDTLNYYRDIEKRYPGDNEMLDKAWKAVCDLGRDNARTPVQWSADGKTSAGFTTEGATPWIRVNDNYKVINVESQLNDPESVRSYWKKMVALRKSEPGLFIHGRYVVDDEPNENTFTFVKREIIDGKDTSRKALVVLNFTAKTQEIVFPEEVKGKKLEIALTNVDHNEDKLQPWEGRVYVERK